MRTKQPILSEQLMELVRVDKFYAGFLCKLPGLHGEVRRGDEDAFHCPFCHYGTEEIPHGRSPDEIIGCESLALEQIASAENRLVERSDDVDSAVPACLGHLSLKAHPTLAMQL